MTHQAPPPPASSGPDAGRQVAQLRQALELVERIAGRSRARAASDDALDEAARISGAYGDALPIVQRRFDALAAEAEAWAAAGVEALLASSQGSPSVAAASHLADELDETLSQLSRLLRL